MEFTNWAKPTYRSHLDSNAATGNQFKSHLKLEQKFVPAPPTIIWVACGSTVARPYTHPSSSNDLQWSTDDAQRCARPVHGLRVALPIGDVKWLYSDIWWHHTHFSPGAPPVQTIETDNNKPYCRWSLEALILFSWFLTGIFLSVISISPLKFVSLTMFFSNI